MTAPPSTAVAPQAPGVPLARLRPEHTRPPVQVPLFPVPQQDCPEAPQVEQVFPAVASTQLSVEVQAVTPPSMAGPPATAQQSCPAPPHPAQVPGRPVAVSRLEQAKPALHVPAPVPQQDWFEPPHEAEHVFPVAPTTHERPVVQAVVPPPPPAQQACPSPPHALHVPGTPWARARPEHAKPVLQVPLFPVPQQDCPEPPQVEQVFPPAATVHDKPVPQPAAPGQQA
jgi:hypothetical protein